MNRDNIVKILNLHTWHFQQIIPSPAIPLSSHGGEDLRLLVLRKRVVPPMSEKPQHRKKDMAQKSTLPPKEWEEMAEGGDPERTGPAWVSQRPSVCLSGGREREADRHAVVVKS